MIRAARFEEDAAPFSLLGEIAVDIMHEQIVQVDAVHNARPIADDTYAGALQGMRFARRDWLFPDLRHPSIRRCGATARVQRLPFSINLRRLGALAIHVDRDELRLLIDQLPLTPAA